MPIEDADRWDRRYQSPFGFNTKSPAPFLLENLSKLPGRGIALDIAIGSGRNAGVLCEHGLVVYGLDISFQALHIAKMKYPDLNVILADLTSYILPALQFNVILNFFYLQRNLIKEFHKFISPGGFLVIETLTSKIKDIHPDIPDDYLLKENELLGLLDPGWKILEYKEGWFVSHSGKKKPVAALLAQFID